MYGSAQVVEAYKYQFSQAKEELKAFCERETLNGELYVGIPNTVERYNEGRKELKKKYDTQVICILDRSGYIHELISETEKEWLINRKRK